MPRVFSAVLIMMAASSPLRAQCSDADKQALEAFDRAWGEATTAGDRARLEMIYADDYWGASFTGVVNKAESIENAVRQAERNRANPQAVPSTSYGPYNITCTPASALITHRNMTTSTAGGRERTSYSRSVHALEKRAGRWQVVGNAGHGLDDVAVLQYMEADWNEATKRHDGAWFGRHLADDATAIGSRTGALESKTEVIASQQADKTVFESLELSDLNVRLDGNTAVVTGVNRVRGRDQQGRAFDRRVRFTDTFVKRDGRWLVWASQGTLIQ